MSSAGDAPGNEHAGSGAGRSSSNDSFVSRSRTDEKNSSSRTRSDADTAPKSACRWSDTADSTLRRTMVVGSGVKSARLGSLKPSPKMRA